MRKHLVAGLIVIIIVLLLGLFAGVAKAGTATFSGEIGTTSPTHNPGMLSNCLSLAGAWHYQAHAFTVSQSGSYTFKEAGTPLDAFIGLYGTPYNPGVVTGTGSNCLATSRDSLTVNLNTGTTYVLVVEPTHLASTGGYSVSASGPGTIDATSLPGSGEQGGPQAGCRNNCTQFNIPFGYHAVSLFHGIDGEGHAAVDAYCVDEFGGTLGGQLTQADLSAVSVDTSTTVLIKSVTTCHDPVSFYRLAGGELQANIYLVRDSKLIVVNFTGLSADNLHYSVIEFLVQ